MAGGETFPLQQPIMILILSGSTLGDLTNEPLKNLTYSILPMYIYYLRICMHQVLSPLKNSKKVKFWKSEVFG